MVTLTSNVLAARLEALQADTAELAINLHQLEIDLVSALPKAPPQLRETRRMVAQAHDEAAGLRAGLTTLAVAARAHKWGE